MSGPRYSKEALEDSAGQPLVDVSVREPHRTAPGSPETRIFEYPSVVGLLLPVVGGLELVGWDVTDRLEQPAVVGSVCRALLTSAHFCTRSTRAGPPSPPTIGSGAQTRS